MSRPSANADAARPTGGRIAINAAHSRTVLFVGGLAAVLLGAMVAVLPPNRAILMTAGVLALVCLSVMPFRILLALWASSLAIWAVGPLDPVQMDVIRIATAALLVIRGARVTPARRAAVTSWVIVLVITGLLVWIGSAPRLGAAIVIPALLVGAVLFRTEDTRTILLGYSVGVSVSAGVLLLTAIGIDGLAPNANPGVDRLTGLANNAPRISTQCAAAIVITLGIGWSQHRVRNSVVLVFSSLALVASGGRVGVLCLVLAALVARYHRWLTFPRSLAAVAGGAVVLGLAAMAGVGTATISRFSAASQVADVDFSSGRLSVVRPAVTSIISNPVVPQGLDTFEAEFGIAPHSPLLSFGLAGGLAASLLVLVMVARLFVLLARRHAWADSQVRASVLVLAVLLGYALVEPDGPFVGVEMLTLLLASATTVAANQTRSTPAETRQPGPEPGPGERPRSSAEPPATAPEVHRLRSGRLPPRP